MKLFKFLSLVSLGLVLMAGCTKSEPVNTAAPVEKRTESKFEIPPKTADGFAVPENMTLDEGPVRDVEK